MSTIHYQDHTGTARVFQTTERMLPFLKPILEGSVYPPTIHCQQPRVILDIGANHGAATVFFAETHPQARLFAFEPASAAFALLTRNVAFLGDRVTRFNAGILDQAGEHRLYAGPCNEGEASIHADDGRDASVFEQARFLPLQDFPGIALDEVDIVKIDVEGAECEVLSNVLAHCDPRVIYIEYQNAANRLRIEQALLGRMHLVMCRVLSLHTGEMIYARA